MKSAEHATIGVVVSTVGVALMRSRSLPRRAVLWVYGVLLSVFIDLDHFVIARDRTGDWSILRRCLRDPVWAFTEQDEVFSDLEEDIDFERLVSHAVLGGLLTAGWYLVSPVVAVYTAVVLYFHVLADVVREAELL
ncbi:hypothetical protein [Halomarina litorea]|uniref:hypothetical protein n=1 Tax=Halomarina litorea TaxID=2961595 RepID=UPI0020C50E38|nr:hypothetical protein [Halomarina sp. BCD28]